MHACSPFIDFDFWRGKNASPKMIMLQFGPLSQVKRTRKMTHLLHNTESK